MPESTSLFRSALFDSLVSAPPEKRYPVEFWLGALFFILLACVPWLASFLGEPFYVRLLMRMMIFSIMALSLNLILGYGGMVSFGHSMFVGVAAYVVGILGYHAYEANALAIGPFQIQGSLNALFTWPIAVAATALVALMLGAVVLRTSGLYFIMITLALAQMLYFLAVSMEDYGGEDGLQVMGTQMLGNLDLSHRTTLYYVVWVCLCGVFLGCRTLVNSRFGLVLKASRQNADRLRAIGLPVFWYKLVAFVISGAIAGLAGVLLVSSQSFVSPADMAWTRSGDLIVMVVIGGMGSLFGPVLGAFFYLAAEYVLGNITEYWQMIMGPLLIVIVLYARTGIVGVFLGAGERKNRI
ncbi:MAG TPA: branched-chain amino acid ABC transporter permease [Eoetvoesiella sp.]|uniref:branched-chain amino acid ABC transporter permease n=1 Tax=Eoetvoesiella sp. TaxID=1966355 RepID=UPI002BAFE3D1|nr:branched-chain amino acid ABC transporter permease [Eoetvoesiella sp.]HWK61280.1 branched-chain amino acid ABC transporter permease [Eoetvoesiella sp.]